MSDQGAGGAYEISSRMTALIGWAATTDFAEKWVSKVDIFHLSIIYTYIFSFQFYLSIVQARKTLLHQSFLKLMILIFMIKMKIAKRLEELVVILMEEYWLSQIQLILTHIHLIGDFIV